MRRPEEPVSPGLASGQGKIGRSSHAYRTVVKASRRESALWEKRTARVSWMIQRARGEGRLRREDLVSVIVPAHSAAPFIRDAVTSALSQTYENIEVIVVDDASGDGTAQIVGEMASGDNRIRLFSHDTNLGPGTSRNKAIREARGRYLAFLDADDMWERNKLEEQLEFIKSRGVGFSYTAYSLIAVDGRPLGKVIDLNAKDRVNYVDMLCKKSTMGCSTVVLDRDVTGPIAMPSLRTGQDYGLWLSLLKRGLDAFCLKESLTRYRIVPGSVSRNKIRKAQRQWQIYREYEDLALLPSIWYFVNYASRALLR